MGTKIRPSFAIHKDVSKNGLTIADDYREHWIQLITFAAETNAADTHTQRDAKRHNIYVRER